MNLAVIANLVVFALVLAWLASRRRQGTPLSTTVLVAVLLGVVLGVAAQTGLRIGQPGDHRHHVLGRRGRAVSTCACSRW